MVNLSRFDGIYIVSVLNLNLYYPCYIFEVFDICFFVVAVDFIFGLEIVDEEE